MKIVRRANIELNVEDTQLPAMQRLGFEEIDPKTGKVLNPKKTELEKLSEENEILRKENDALKAQLDTALKDQAVKSKK